MKVENQNKSQKIEKAKTNLIAKPGKQLAKLSDFADISREEVQGGMDTQGGYLASYSKLIKTQQDKFEIIDQTSNNVVKTLDKLENAIVFYAHPVYRLYRGTVNGETSDMQSWEETDREIVAMSYDNPYGKLHSSRGNFDKEGFGDWLDNKEKKKLLSKRLYVFISLPNIYPGEIIPATFGITAQKQLSSVIQMLRMINLNLAMVYQQISLVSEKSKQGYAYNRVCFDICVDGEGRPIPVVNSSEIYRQKIKPILNKIIDTHEFAALYQEQSTGLVKGESSPSEVDITPENLNDDDIPF